MSPGGPAEVAPPRRWVCLICGLVYDEALGWPADGIPPGTPWAAVPADWQCPDCGVGKADFEMIDLPPTPSTGAVEPGASACAQAVVIVGAGHAGYAAAEAIRRRWPAQRIVLVTQDAGDRYAKPRLSVSLCPPSAHSPLITEHAEDAARRLGIELHRRCIALRIDRAGRLLHTTAGAIGYGRLVLATGARALRLPWYDEQVLSLNHLDDLQRLRERLAVPRQVQLLGAGLIGCELANHLARAGHRVVVQSPAAHALDRLAPAAIGHALQARLAALGVEWRFGAAPAARWGEVVISAVGLCPVVELAREAGLATGHGIRVDDDGRSTDPDVFALGDAAEFTDGPKPYIAPLLHTAERLAAAVQHRASPGAQAPWPPMPVVLKTPDCPVAVLAPPAAVPTTWRCEAGADGTVARALDAQGRLMGFALAGPVAAQHERWVVQTGR